MRVLELRAGSLQETSALSAALLARAQSEGVPWLACTVLTDAGVALGAVQRAGAVVQTVNTVVRRHTTGTAARVSPQTLWWSLALPTVGTLVHDATARTVLNRNVRGVLRGFTKAGAQAMYAGRECIMVQHRPCALLGLEWAADGAVLIDVIAGWEASVALRTEEMSQRERDTDRWRGREALALREVVGAKSVEAFGHAVMVAVASHAGQTIEWVDAMERGANECADDPCPAGWVVGPGVRVPIGWIDAAVPVDPADERAWIGGDVLTGTNALAAAARGEAWGDAPLEGALPSDLAAAVALARSARAARAAMPKEGDGAARSGARDAAKGWV